MEDPNKLKSNFSAQELLVEIEENKNEQHSGFKDRTTDTSF